MNGNGIRALRYRRNTAIAAKSLLFVLIVVTHLMVASAAAAAVKPFYILTENPTDSQLQFIASHYDMVDDDRANLTAAQIDRLHSLNPSIKVLKYVNGTNVNIRNKDYAWIDANHPDWFLLDAKANRIYTKANNYGLAPGDPEVQQWFAQKCRDILAEKPYDGIYFDVIIASPYMYTDPATGERAVAINPDTGVPYTYAEWQSHQQRKLSVVKTAIGRDKLLIFNGLTFNNYFPGSNGEGYRFWNSSADGAVIEGFMRWPDEPISSFRSEANWKRDVDMLSDSLSKGKIVLVQTGFDVNAPVSDGERTSISMYALTSFLLGADGENAYFSTRNVDTIATGHPHETPFDETWLTDIGEPAGPYYKANNVYQRDFTRGKVLVNPHASNTYTVSLGGNYRTLAGRTVSEVALGPHTGVLLVDDGEAAASPAGDGNGESFITINKGDVYTSSRQVTIELFPPATPAAVSLSNDGVGWSAPLPFKPHMRWTLTPGDGRKTVLAKFQYPTGWSGPFDASITLDSIPPVISLDDDVFSAAGLVVRPGHKTVVARVDDAFGVSKVEFYINGRLMVVDTELPYTYKLKAISSLSRYCTFRAQAYDMAGNVGQVVRYVPMSKTRPKVADKTSHAATARGLRLPVSVERVRQNYNATGDILAPCGYLPYELSLAALMESQAIKPMMSKNSTTSKTSF